MVNFSGNLCEENLTTLFARLQETEILTISSGLHICGSSYPLQWEFIFQAGWQNYLASGWHCAFLYWTKRPNVLKTSHFQALYTLLRFLPQLFQLRARDGTMRGHWQWPGSCWLQGQHHLLDPTSPPVQVELFGSFKFHREITGRGASGKAWDHIKEESGMFTCTTKLTFG